MPATAPQPNRRADAVRAQVERLAADYADLVLRVAYARLGSTADAQDICQTVFLKLLRLGRNGLARFASAEHEKAWIIRATINACIDLQRSAWNRTVVPLEEGSEAAKEPGAIGGPDAAAASPFGLDPDLPDPAKAHEVDEAVAALPPAYREAIYLHYYEEYSVKDIAALTGETPGTVRKHLSRARAKLRGILKGDER